jgi:hypothetical protein
MTILQRFAIIQRASIDEAFLDLTTAVEQRLEEMRKAAGGDVALSAEDWQGHVLGGAFKPASAVDVRLCVGSQIVAGIRETIFSELGYSVRCQSVHTCEPAARVILSRAALESPRRRSSPRQWPACTSRGSKPSCHPPTCPSCCRRSSCARSRYDARRAAQG